MWILEKAFRIVVFAISALIGGAIGGVVGYELARRVLPTEPRYVSAPEFSTWKHTVQAIMIIGIVAGAVTLTAAGNVAVSLVTRNIADIANEIRRRFGRPGV
ncbi:MAG TPA: hypothetical protein VHY91_25815 [Pirellulales bacterium]|jgi:membrane protein YqaA with SNARE-associated domain|nr:hypothetical protein [Pirellulales bacterium]